MISEMIYVIQMPLTICFAEWYTSKKFDKFIPRRTGPFKVFKILKDVLEDDKSFITNTI